MALLLALVTEKYTGIFSAAEDQHSCISEFAIISLWSSLSAFVFITGWWWNPPIISELYFFKELVDFYLYFIFLVVLSPCNTHSFTISKIAGPFDLDTLQFWLLTSQVSFTPLLTQGRWESIIYLFARSSSQCVMKQTISQTCPAVTKGTGTCTRSVATPAKVLFVSLLVAL